MTTFFITRHPGARVWAEQEGIRVDRLLDHLDPVEIQANDAVLGTLPVHLAAEVCARGARYLHLTLALPPECRGKELSAEDLRRFGASLREFEVRAVDSA
ncbi:CRISPR-associated protein Csx16 [Methylococcus geothermalis]|uniref:CRISPR-associated protein Csx16 n=2 Tax=Methylococcus geothermalis TaxID=2681310 RepID=A0A858QC92_9GAMM|nr:CRISPR-associated protein Csx16 [Methylococcus geothermalis]